MGENFAGPQGVREWENEAVEKGIGEQKPRLGGISIHIFLPAIISNRQFEEKTKRKSQKLKL